MAFDMKRSFTVGRMAERSHQSPRVGFRIRPAVSGVVVATTTLLVIIACWHLTAVTIFAASEVFPSPLAALHAFRKDIATKELWGDSIASLKRVAVGFAIAACLGVGLSALVLIAEKFRPFVVSAVEFFRPIPPLAWVPLAILWFGIGDPSAYYIVFLAAFFPIFTNSLTGLLSVDPVYVQLAQSLRLPRSSYLGHIAFPAALPHIIAGFRIALGFSWMAVIASEMIAAQSGLGYRINLSRLLLQSEQVVVGMVVIAAIGYTMNKLVLWIGSRMTPWEIAQQQ